MDLAPSQNLAASAPKDGSVLMADADVKAARAWGVQSALPEVSVALSSRFQLLGVSVSRGANIDRGADIDQPECQASQCGAHWLWRWRFLVDAAGPRQGPVTHLQVHQARKNSR
jgi:hypothetical protein